MPAPRARRLAPIGGWFVALIVALLAPFVLDGYGVLVATSVLTYTMLGLGLNVVVGYAGLLDLGYAAFFAIGAYTSALLALHGGLSFWATLPVSLVAVAIAGCIIGYPTLRLRSDYLAIVTLGFGEIVRITATNLTITGGPNGLYGIPAPSLGGDPIVSGRGLYYLALVFTVVALLFTSALSRSRLGRAWRSLREDETAAEAVGVPTIRVKLLAYVMGALVAGLAGPFFVTRFGAVDPTTFTYQTSVLILIVVIVGGMGSIPGTVLGAIVVVVLPEVLRSVSGFRMLIFALALVALMLVRPQGLWPARRARHEALLAPEAEPRPPAPGPPAGEPVLTVEGLERRFGGVRAVDDLSFTVRSGEIVSIIGPNGAGKTTVFNCVTGMIRPARGRIVLYGPQDRGRSLSKLAPHRVVAAGVARTFQGIRLFNAMTVVDNVLVGRYPQQSFRRARLGRHLATGATPEDRREVRRLLDFVGLTRYAGHIASELSYGDKRRLEIARALASEPRVLLLDEPAAGTNPTEKNDLVGLIRRVRDRGIAVVLIEHDMAVVMGISDRVIVMDQGQKIAEGLPVEVRDDPRVIDAYLGGMEETAESAEEVLGWRS